jgi:glycosyltransferase involved in cell wall biosynthesis
MWKSQKNHGAPVARNAGISLASGFFVKFLDADEILCKNIVKNQVEAISRMEKERAVVFGDRHCSKRKNVNPESKTFKKVGTKYLVNEGVTTPCVLHKTKLLNEVNGFKEGLTCGQEYELHLRMQLEGIHFFYQPGGAIVKRANSPEGISHKTFAGLSPAHRIRLYRRIWSLLEGSYEEVPRPVRESLAKRWWIIGRQALRGGHEQEAKTCFEAAQELSKHHAVGSRSYRLLTHLLGPYWAEHFGMWIKKYLSLQQ